MFNFVVLGSIGVTEIILIVLALLLLFGGRKIPELMRGLGQGLHEFKKASQGGEANNTKNEAKDTPKELKN
ncbi:MAG: twin-arginine translocase TatA/TatE family subunit [Bacteroidales bacterium]|nr:twin-arginine translocase TatA/TatE family subunit [Bacteroidales bacterium]HPO66308.1 twin-arginine translocase TatA/TatE family subunit [Bacteroidales bacterium]